MKQKIINRRNGVLWVLLVFAVIALVGSVVLKLNAKAIGDRVGSLSGSLAGRAIGSLEGMTTGRIEGGKAGKEAGLSAEDTEAMIVDEFQHMEKLEVLAASVKLSDFHSIGKDAEKYAALYLVNGNIVFTVDLSVAEIESKDDGIHILIPEPEGTLYLDDSSVEKVAEYQRKLFNGSAEDGFDAYINTMAKVQNASEKTLDNYNVLISEAKRAAEKQIRLLVQSVSTTTSEVFIEFKG